MPQPPIAPDRTRPLAEELYREHLPKLLGSARLAGAGDEAEDAVSRGIAIFIARFDPDGESPALPWLLLTIKREAYQLRRRRARYATELVRTRLERGMLESDLDLDAVVEDPEAPEGLEGTLQGETLDQRWEALAQLKPNERKCLGLKGLGYSYTEIQAMTGWSHTKVNRLMVEGRAALRKILS